MLHPLVDSADAAPHDFLSAETLACRAAVWCRSAGSHSGPADAARGRPPPYRQWRRAMCGTGTKTRSWLFPVVGASQVRALRSERSHLVVGGLDHPGGALFADYFPPVDAGAAIGRSPPARSSASRPTSRDLNSTFLAFFHLGGDQRMDGPGRQAEHGRNRRPEAVNCDCVEVAAAGVFAWWRTFARHHLKSPSAPDLSLNCIQFAKSDEVRPGGGDARTDYLVSGLFDGAPAPGRNSGV